MSATSTYSLGDKVTFGKNETVVSVSCIATEKDASGVDYAMVSTTAGGEAVRCDQAARLVDS